MIKECRACKSDDLTEFLDLGEQYLSDFREDDKLPPKYPLVAVLCGSCALVQLRDTTPQSEMYHDRYGFKSGISDSIKNDLHDIVFHAQQYRDTPKSWLDIASNDGTLLSFVPKVTKKVGVDPVTFLCEEAAQHADYIVNDYFNSESVKEKFDVITSISCFYDMPDPTQFVEDVKNVLNDDGVWVIQQNYLLTTMELGAVDNFCHEHLEYYTLISLKKLLEKCGLEINEVKLSMVNGGSIRTIVSHKGTFPVDKSVDDQLEKEENYGLNSLAPYKEFSEKVGENLDKLYRTVKELKDNGNRICILAASTRGATLWQSANIGKELVDYAVERNVAKNGKRFSAIDIPIVSEETFRKDQPDYALIGPWFFADEIIKREHEYAERGGKFITPLPKVEIV